MRFLGKNAGVGLSVRVKNTDIRSELLLHAERRQLKCFRHLVKMPPGQVHPFKRFYKHAHQ